MLIGQREFVYYVIVKELKMNIILYYLALCYIRYI